jgi:hypothetical protein
LVAALDLQEARHTHDDRDTTVMTVEAAVSEWRKSRSESKDLQEKPKVSSNLHTKTENVFIRFGMRTLISFPLFAVV